MCPLSSLSPESKTFQSGNLAWPELDMFRLENTLSRKHFLLFLSVKKSFIVTVVCFLKAMYTSLVEPFSALLTWVEEKMFSVISAQFVV